MLKVKYHFILIIFYQLSLFGQHPGNRDFSQDPIYLLTTYLSENKDMARYYPTIFPFNSSFTISSDYGERTHPIHGNIQFHTGIDFTCPKGTTVFSPAFGRVLKVVHDDGVIGNSITISHLDGWSSSFSHLESIKVTVDQLVEPYQSIGTAGNTGSVTGNHLHYSIYYKKKSVDPLPFCYLFTYINELEDK